MAHDGEALDPTSSRPASPAGTASGPPSSLAARQGGAASDGEIHDDDALADALAAEYTWMATAAIPIVSSPETQADVPLFIEPHVLEQEDSSSQDFAPLDFGAAPADASAPADEPAASDAAPPAWEPGEIINAAPVWEPPASTEPESAVRGEEESPADSAPVEKHDAPVERRDEPDVVQAAPLWDEPAGTVDPGLPSFVSPFDSPALPEVSSDEELTPWSSLPAPDPTHAVQHPDAPPQFLAATPIADWPAPSFDEPVAAEFERAAESERPGPNAWTAWAPVAAAPSEWDAAASVSPPVAPDEAAAVQPSFPVEPESEVEPVSLDAPAPEFDPTPEPEAEAQSEPEPEQFPWIAAAAAAAAAPPLVQPVESDPFNWSITATGKVAYLDEPVSPTVEPAEGASAEAASTEGAGTEPARTEADDPPPRMFSPPPLVEPLAAPQPTPAAGLPFAPPTYLPVGEPERGPSDREEPLGYPDADPVDPAQAAPQSMFIEPTPLDSLSAALPTGVGSSVPTATGSISIIDQAYEEELEDDVDDTDRASAALVGGTGGTTVVAPPTSALPPSGPISTVRIAEDESVLYSDEPSNQRVFSLEKSGVEPTPVERRAGRAARLFWLWFAANSSIISVALGAVVFAAGMSLRQSVVAILAGVALSFIPLGLTTLAGKRSGQPTMVVSRATFGLLGNILPALLALVSRVFWGGVLLWVLATSVSSILVGAGASGGLTEDLLVYLCLAGGLVVALLIASMGYPLLARIQLIVTIVASILIVGLIVLTAQFIDVAQALTIADGSWLLTIAGAVLVFSFVGLVWAHSGADLARYQRPSSSGASSMLWATFGMTIPAFVLVAYGALLAASDPGIAAGFARQPLETLAGMLPSWYPVPLILATALSLLSGVVLTLYSGGLALQSAGIMLPRPWSTVVVGLLLAVTAVILVFTLTDGIGAVFRDLATTLAVPTASWVGIFSSEVMIRNRRFESESLLTRGGVYPDVRWGNLIGLVIITVIGFSLTTAAVDWLSWQGYGFALLGVNPGSDLAGTDVGVLVALALGLLLPLVTAIPAIRRQEAARV